MSVVRLDRWVGVLAAALFVLSVAGFGAALPDYSQALHPVTWLGAHGIPHALGFNLLGLVLPAALAQRLAFACWALWLALALPLSRGR